MVKNLPAMWETQVWSLVREDPLEKGMATHSSILAWRIPWTEEPSGLQSMGSQRVEHDWATNTRGFPGDTSGKEFPWQWRRCKRHGFNLWVRKIPWRRKWQPTLAFLPGESHGQKSLAPTVHGVAKESATTQRLNSTYISSPSSGMMKSRKYFIQVHKIIKIMDKANRDIFTKLENTRIKHTT